MSSRLYGTPLRIECRPSRYCVLWLSAVHGGALLALLFSPLHGLPAAGLASAVVAGFAVSLRRCVGTPVTLLWDGDGRWHWMEGEGNDEVSLLPHSVVWPWLVVLNFRDAENRRRALPIFPDSLEAESFRRLRVRLRYEGIGRA